MALEMWRGDTFYATAPALDLDGSTFDLTGFTIFFTAKNAVSDDDVDAVLKYDSVNDTDKIFATTPSNGIITLRIPPSDTESMLINGSKTLYYDVQIEDTVTGDIYTVDYDTLKIKEDITRRS